ncbi:hypothetical protein [Chondromyces apiculatus]|uniref:Uncharacterized protein n=1 Tax=Chondromyces apiculatus DSM 436 TaxID=1192034 RepID=A0A017SWD3_9BACT|nr:hypothetical protein [Chondromyces apiculatus]EYF00606.1 Hypothetical protein CAP_0421 [Chondromyces apiculatus DSM 436]
MELHQQLLKQAIKLARIDPKKPVQANLRRAISSAYYALFHLLIHEATGSLLGPPSGGIATEINLGARRWFDHGSMKTVAGWVGGIKTPDKVNALFPSSPAAAPQQASPPAKSPPRLFSTLASAELKSVASAFIALQEARHRADYDLTARFTRQDTLQMVDRAQKAFSDWELARDTDPLAPLFLLLLLLSGDKLLPKAH